MKKLTFDEIRKDLSYHYLAGSWCHGIGIEGISDYDYAGVFICPQEALYGVRSEYVQQVSDEHHNENYYELGRWVELLLKSNPTSLESLFVDKKFVIGDIHPAVQKFIDNRDLFLTKEAFKPTLGYALKQCSKAKGYNKKCNIPEDFRRKDILDFCYTFNEQGSIPIKDYIKNFNLDQRYCGLVNIPNMYNMYGLYYDFAAFFKFKKINLFKSPEYRRFIQTISQEEKIYERMKNKDFYGYSGIVHPNMEIKKSDGSKVTLYNVVSEGEYGAFWESNEVRLSSIPKGEKPICFMSFNKDAYASHCREYKEWSDWKKNRNQTRYNDNKGYNFDAKNMCELVRLIHTGIEIARDGVYNVERTWDRDFLLDIKHHKKTYEEIMEYVNEKRAEFDELIKTCTLPESVDKEKVNQMLIEARKEIYKNI